jgi:hypothetical protein
LFYEEFVLEEKGRSTIRGVSENDKMSCMSIQWGSLWSLKKVLCALIMIQGLVNRRRDLNEEKLKSRKMLVTSRLKLTSATSPSPWSGDLVVPIAPITFDCREEGYACTLILGLIGNLV